MRMVGNTRSHEIFGIVGEGHQDFGRSDPIAGDSPSDVLRRMVRQRDEHVRWCRGIQGNLMLHG